MKNKKFAAGEKPAEKNTEGRSPAVFTKQKVLTLSRYAGRRDLLSSLLEDGKLYSTDQVDGLIRNFMEKGKVR